VPLALGATPGASGVGRVTAVAGTARRHAGLLLLLGVAAVLRVLATIAISPGIWFSDSNNYIAAAATGRLSETRVDGYSLIVAPFWHAGSASALVGFQHLIGLAIVVVLYALLLRRGVPRWMALLAVVPAALDAYLIVVEHAVMSETVFHAALVGAIVALLWQERPSLAAAAAGGLLLGYAGDVRSVAVPLVLVFLAYLLVRRVGWQRVAVFAAGWLLVAGAYVALFDAQHGKLGFTVSGGRFLYGRVAPFADCRTLEGLPANERSLCPDPKHRLTTTAYVWGRHSPIADLPPTSDRRIRDFAVRVLRQQPFDYAGLVLGGALHYFEPGHRIGFNDAPICTWQFPVDPLTVDFPCYRGPIRPGNVARGRRHRTTEPNRYVAAMVSRPHGDAGVSRFLRGYQSVAYTWGPLLAACLLLVLGAVIARRGTWRGRLDAALLATVTLLALLVSQALAIFSYRYGLIAVLLLPAAAALAGAGLRSGRSSVTISPSASTTDQPPRRSRRIARAFARRTSARSVATPRSSA
jgi:hypothetical protein